MNEELKPCPFCGNHVTIKNENDSFILECENCKNNDIIIMVKDSSKENVINKWNNRVFENFIMDNREKAFEILDTYDGKSNKPIPSDLKEEYKDYVYTIKTVNNPNCLIKYLITPNNEYHLIEEHCKAIADVMNLHMNDFMNESSYDFSEMFLIYALHIGYIKLDIFNNVIAIQYEIITKDQVKFLEKFLIDNILPSKNIDDLTFIVEKLSEKSNQIFSDVFDMLEYLELDTKKSPL